MEDYAKTVSKKQTLRVYMRKGCRGWAIKGDYHLGDDIQSKVPAFAFGLSAEIERDFISRRTKEALARKKVQGVALGRPRGRKNTPEKHPWHTRRQRIEAMLAQGLSKSEIAR